MRALFVLVAVSLLIGGCDGGDTETVTGELAPIESVDIRIAESFPPQYFLDVVSGLPSGCASFDHYEVTRSGDSIEVAVWNRIQAPPNGACTAIYGMVEHSIALGSDFESGRIYTVRVNDEVRTFTAQ
ncbi:MAG: hypothetical protein R3B59_12660 [Dehalococcoidia bacterium]